MMLDGASTDPRALLRKKRVLILVTDIGFGHRSAAEAVAVAIRQRYGHICTVEIVNPINETDAPDFVRNAQFDYDRIIRDWPQLYKFSNKISNLSLSKGLNEVALTFILYDSLSTVVKQHQPDVIVITHPTLQYPLLGYRRISGARVPLATVITDLVDLHRLWFNKDIDRYLVPTIATAELAVEKGVDPSRVRITGLPVNPALVQETRTPAEARLDLGLMPDLFTMLVVSSKRIEHMEAFINVLNHAGFPMQVIAVAGGDDALWETLRSTTWHVPVRIFNYVEDMSGLMRAADCLVTKAGGLIVAESLACGRPMLIVQHRPLHEEGNARFVVENGAGDVADEPILLLETLAHWLEDEGALFHDRARRAAQVGRPDAAFQAADEIFDLLQRTSPNVADLSPVEAEELRQLWEEFRPSAER